MKLFDDEFIQFIDDHIEDDPIRLRLKYSSLGPDYAEAISQIQLRRKAPMKFIDPADGADLRPRWLPSEVSVEQSSSAAIARFHTSIIAPARKILDMTMGMGIDASTMARLIPGSEVTAIELNERLYAFAKENYGGIPNLHIVNGDSVDWIKEHQTERFDAIFIDPARRDAAGARVCNIHDCAPDIAQLLPQLLEMSSKILVKLSPMLDITATLRDLSHVSDIYAVEERGECREILVLIKGKAVSADAVIHAINLSTGIDFSFTSNDEAEAAPEFAMPNEGDYLYEPSAAAMKVGAFKLISSRFHSPAISANTHLYLSSQPVEDFPGKQYRIEAVLPYSSSVIKRFSRRWPAASVAVRNFQIDAAALRKRLGTRESDSLRVYGVTNLKGEPMLLVVSISRKRGL